MVQVLSGYVLYYSTGSFHDVATTLHEVLGVVTSAFAQTDWLRNRNTAGTP